MRLMDKCVGIIGNVVGETDVGGDDGDDDDNDDDDAVVDVKKKMV